MSKQALLEHLRQSHWTNTRYKTMALEESLIKIPDLFESHNYCHNVNVNLDKHVHNGMR